MKPLARTLVFVILLGVLAVPAFAQPEPPANQQPQSQSEQQMAEYLPGSFLMSHSGIAGDLQNNPSLFQDSNYLAQHPELQKFLDNNPQVVQMLTDPNFRTQELSQQDWRSLLQNTTGQSPGQMVGSLIDNWLGTGVSDGINNNESDSSNNR